MVADGRRGKRGIEAQGFDPPLDFEGGGPQGGEPWRRAEAVSSKRDGGAVGPGGGWSYREKGEGAKGVLSPALVRDGARRGGGSAVAGILEAAAMAMAAVGARGGS